VQFNLKPPWQKGERTDTPMEHNRREHLENQVEEKSKLALEAIIRKGARKMLQAAIENEIVGILYNIEDIETLGM